jgi:fumarate hydratase class II
MEEMRQETDSLGVVHVPKDRLWGAQTQRALINFQIGHTKMPKEVIEAILAIKEAAAVANFELNVLEEEKKTLIGDAIRSLHNKELSSEFPLNVWQTGSGTQTNMNVNEVIANKANTLAGKPLGSKSPIHPNDHVNKSQSTNDVFPTAMHIACAQAIVHRLLPSISLLHETLTTKATAFHHIIKVGRTHLMDAVPIRLGQEFSGYASQIEHIQNTISHTLPRLYELALGGTAVGTGLNCPKGFKESAIHKIATKYDLPFTPAKNPFEALASHDALLEISSCCKVLACALFKIANDIRLMASGPRCGLAELILPENEPGSSIMPGKVNPTQCEVVTQVACQVVGNDTAITMAASQGHLELNAYKPLIIKNCLDSISLLADVCVSFSEKCLSSLEANVPRIQHFLNQSLMLATALSKEIGYDATARITLLATHENIPLKEAALKLGEISAERFDQITDPTTMVD